MLNISYTLDSIFLSFVNYMLAFLPFSIGVFNLFLFIYKRYLPFLVSCVTDTFPVLTFVVKYCYGFLLFVHLNLCCCFENGGFRSLPISEFSRRW